MRHLAVFRSLSLAIAAATVLAGCTTGSTPRPYTEPVVDQPGQSITRYRGPELEVLVSTRHAASQIGGDWLILQVAVGGMVASSAEIRRDQVELRTPQGERLGLMPHREFSSRYSEIAGPARQAAIAAEPLDFSRGDRRDCSLGFMPLPGTSVVREAVHVDQRQLCQGLLYFHLPEGVQRGPYRLEIELDERRVEVPFELR